MTFGRCGGGEVVMLGGGGEGRSRGWDVVGVRVHGLGFVDWEGFGEGVAVVSRKRESSALSSSSLGAGRASARWVAVGICFSCILFNAFCVRLFLLLSNSLAIFTPSCLSSVLMPSFCSAVLDASSFACHFRSLTIYAIPLSTSNLASSG